MEVAWKGTCSRQGALNFINSQLMIAVLWCSEYHGYTHMSYS